LSGITKSGWLPLARLLRPQGRRGELLAEPLSDLPGILSAGRELVIAGPDATTPPSGAPKVVLDEVWFPTGKNAGRIVLKLSGCDSIDDAQRLAGKQLLLAALELPALAPDTFFVGDLVGCTLFNAEIPVGTITDVEFATGPDGRTRLEDAAPLLAVQLTSSDSSTSPDSDPILIPFVRAWLDAVDIAGRRVVMHLPAGLVDPADAVIDTTTDLPVQNE
jgi:16S rRNA processing protein RimM